MFRHCFDFKAVRSFWDSRGLSFPKVLGALFCIDTFETRDAECCYNKHEDRFEAEGTTATATVGARRLLVVEHRFLVGPRGLAGLS